MAEVEERYIDHVELTIECPRHVLSLASEDESMVTDIKSKTEHQVSDSELPHETFEEPELVNKFPGECDTSFTDRSEETIESVSPNRIDFNITRVKTYELSNQHRERGSTNEMEGLEDEQNNNAVVSTEYDDTVIQIQDAIAEQVPPISCSSDSLETVMNIKSNASIEQSNKITDENLPPECLEKRRLLENINNNNTATDICIPGVHEDELSASIVDSVECSKILESKDEENSKKCISTVELQVAEDDKIVQLENNSNSEESELKSEVMEVNENVGKKVINLSEARSEVVVDYQTVVVKNQVSVNDSEVNDEDYVVISKTPLDQAEPNEFLQSDKNVSDELVIQVAETDSKTMEVFPATREQNESTATIFNSSGEAIIRSFGTQDYREQNKDIFEPTEQMQQEGYIVPTMTECVEANRNIFPESEIQVQETDMTKKKSVEQSEIKGEYSTFQKVNSPSKHSFAHLAMKSDSGTKANVSSEIDESLQISEETIEQVISELNQRKLEADMIKPTDVPVQETIYSETSVLSEASFSPKIKTKEVPPLEPIEVERKFTFSDDTEEKVLQLGCQLIREQKFLDVYFDNSNYSLTLKDIWLRQRNDSWEMKIPISDKGVENFSTQYIELVNEQDIVEHLTKFFETSSKIGLHDILKSEGIERFANFTTVRKTYSHPECTICLDVADFGFQVGEIEVMVSCKSRIPHALNTIESVAIQLGMSPLEIEQVSVL